MRIKLEPAASKDVVFTMRVSTRAVPLPLHGERSARVTSQEAKQPMRKLPQADERTAYGISRFANHQKLPPLCEHWLP